MSNEDLTPERIAVLVEFADNIMTGKKMIHVVAYIGVIGTSLLAALYYLTSILRNAGIHI